MAWLWSLFFTSLCYTVLADYWEDRENLLQKEKSLQFGNKLILNEKELKANEIIMNLKLQEVDAGFQDPLNFLPSQHFFHSKKAIEENEIYKIIKKLPKGSSLHSHDTGILSDEKLFEFTFWEKLYGCEIEGRMHLQFFNENETSSKCQWKLLSDYRKEDPDFDSKLKAQLSLVVDDPVNAYPDIDVVWREFSKIFSALSELICYKPVFEEYFYQVLKELYEDNVMYLEFRGLLPTVYDLDNNTYGPVEVAGIYYDTLKKFQKDYPDFFGAKLIYAPSRRVDNKTVDNYLTILTDLQAKYPTFIAGFDLVGQEDLGHPLASFIPQLLSIQNTTKFFFHAGETNWYGLPTDQNLIDAVLLNPVRMGHGYGVLKHPEAVRIVQEQDIALEISPISNQVLKLVDDIRNHPASVLIANGFSIVITCDDPSMWGAKGLSHDWYMAFVGLASRDADLRFLKQLAINSIAYSALDWLDLQELLYSWNDSWDNFIDELIQTYTNEIVK